MSMPQYYVVTLTDDSKHVVHCEDGIKARSFMNDIEFENDRTFTTLTKFAKDTVKSYVPTTAEIALAVAGGAPAKREPIRTSLRYVGSRTDLHGPCVIIGARFNSASARVVGFDIIAGGKQIENVRPSSIAGMTEVSPWEAAVDDIVDTMTTLEF